MERVILYLSSLPRQHGTPSARQLQQSHGTLWSGLRRRYQDILLLHGWQYYRDYLQRISFLGSFCSFVVCALLGRTRVSSTLVLPVFIRSKGLGPLLWTIHPFCALIIPRGCWYIIKSSSSSVLSGVIKLLLQCIVYCIWRERNMCIFQQTSTFEAGIYSRVDRLMRDRLVSIPPSSPSSPSPMLVYFRPPPPDP